MFDFTVHNTKSVFRPTIEPIVDAGVFILTTLTFTTWINAPITKGGIVFASVLHASFIWMGQKVGKIDDSSSLFFKEFVTLGAISLSTFAISYLSVITKKGALEMGVFTFTAKTVKTLGLYLLRSIIPTSMPKSTEVGKLEFHDQQKFYTYFSKEKQGIREWSSLNKELKLAFLNEFVERNFFVGSLPLDLDNLTDEEIKTYHEPILIYFSFLKKEDPNLTCILVKLIAKCFRLDLPPPSGLSPIFQSRLCFYPSDIITPEQISKVTRNQVMWVFNTLLFNGCVSNPDKKFFENYIPLFKKHYCFIAIKDLHGDYAKHFYDFYKGHLEIWKSLPSEVQTAFISRFERLPATYSISGLLPT